VVETGENCTVFARPQLQTHQQSLVNPSIRRAQTLALLQFRPRSLRPKRTCCAHWWLDLDGTEIYPAVAFVLTPQAACWRAVQTSAPGAAGSCITPPVPPQPPLRGPRGRVVSLRHDGGVPVSWRFHAGGYRAGAAPSGCFVQQYQASFMATEIFRRSPMRWLRLPQVRRDALLSPPRSMNPVFRRVSSSPPSTQCCCACGGFARPYRP
jgi:hypothetical protein